MNLSIRQIEIFLAILRTERISHAAQELLLTQSAVSMALQEMERQTGGPLFDRLGRRTVLNDRGKMLLPMAVELNDRIAEMKATMQREEIETTLNVAASSTIGNYLLPGHIGLMSARHPELRVKLDIGNTEETTHRILSFASDLGFVEGPCNHPDLICTVWRPDRLLLLVSSAHPLARKKTVRLEELFRFPWILRERGSGTRMIVEQALGARIQKLRMTLELGHTEAIKNALITSDAISCLSAETVRKELKLGLLASLSLPSLHLHRNLYLVLHKKKYRSRPLARFIDELSQAGTVKKSRKRVRIDPERQA